MNRFARQIGLPTVGASGQQRLAEARVLLVGLGGLGCPAALYLASAGVGELLLCDHDRVDESNLARQVLYGNDDLDRPKIEAAADALLRRWPDMKLQGVAERIDEARLASLLDGVDVVLDASDNYATRLAVNAACLARGTPWVMAAAVRFEGQLMVLRPDQAGAPCYHCIYGDAATSLDDCQGSGVFTPLTGTIGSAAAGEVTRLLLGLGHETRLSLFDAQRFAWRQIAVARRDDCPTCSP